MEKILSVIIPFRCENDDSSYIFERLKEHCFTLPCSDERLEFIVVDSSSRVDFSMECKELCEKNGLVYLFHNSRYKSFSIGESRDFGVQYATGKAITFLDVDLRVAEDFWDRLISLMSEWGISKYKKKILAVPALYLTEEGTKEFINLDNKNKYLNFILRWMLGDKDNIQDMGLCSSVMIVDRLHYLSVGGHDPAFRGHGYEDFELYHRLASEDQSIPRPDNYYTDKKSWNTYTYNGFRTYFSIIARPCLLTNLFVIHLWHPRPKTVSFYNNNSLKENRSIWEEKFKAFDKNNNHPEPLTLSESINKKFLFLGSRNSNISRSIKDIFPFLGSAVYSSEYLFWERDIFLEDDLESFIIHNNIEKIIFPNPYGNEARLAIYKWCKKIHFPFICYDRGALPDSQFFDDKGFNADSGSYNSKLYLEKKLSVNELQNIENYISECIVNDNYLEQQGIRVGAEALADKLKIVSKKVLFVPLQRPSDTVIKHMCGYVESYENFIFIINELAEKLKKLGWVVLLKKHPLETNKYDLPNVQYVPDDTNFLDLLDLADAVALINSGVGLYAMMMNKPCYIFGNAFYAVDGVNISINTSDIDEIKDIIVNSYQINYDNVLKFIYYLRYEFYSFGTSKIKKVQEDDLSFRGQTTAIDFYHIKLPHMKFPVVYEKEKNIKISTLVPIFERFGLDLYMKRMESKQVVSPNNKPAAVKATVSPKPKPLVDENSNIIVQKPVEAVQIKADLSKIDSTLTKQNDHENIMGRKVNKKSAKYEKLKRDPRAFFEDSKIAIIKPLKYLFKK